MCQLNLAVGSDETIAQARGAVADYYAFTGRAGWGEPVTDLHQLADTLAGYDELGADEVVLYRYADQPDQVDTQAELHRMIT